MLHDAVEIELNVKSVRNINSIEWICFERYEYIYIIIDSDNISNLSTTLINIYWVGLLYTRLHWICIKDLSKVYATS